MVTTTYDAKIKFFCIDGNNDPSELNLNVSNVKPDSDAFVTAATTFCNYVISDNNTDVLKDDYGKDTNAVGYVVTRIERTANTGIASGGTIPENFTYEEYDNENA